MGAWGVRYLSPFFPSAPGSQASGSYSDWSRSREDFDHTVLPAAIIAGFLVLVGTVAAIIHIHNKSDKEEKLLQQ